jgi:hypothetical protein
METVGISPKVVAATIASYIATLVGGLVVNELGVELDLTAVEAVLLPFITVVVTAIAGFLAKPGQVINKGQQ